MKEIEFSIRFVTPAFLGGAPTGQSPKVYKIDPRIGLRVPTLRAALEFWFRSMHGDKDPEELWNLQGEIFGSTKHGQGISLRATGNNLPRGRKASKWIKELSYSTPFGYKMLYLGYGPLQYDRESRKVRSFYEKDREALHLGPGGTPARFDFTAHCRTSEQARGLRYSLTLLHLFGGLGGRSRRGFGSVQVRADWLPPLDESTDFEADLRQLYRQVFADRLPHPPKARFSAFSLSSEARLTEVRDGNHEVVMVGDFHRRFAEERLWRPADGIQRSDRAQEDHDWERQDAGRRDIARIPERLCYGMPYAPESRQNRWKIEYVGRPEQSCRTPAQQGEGITRRSSPLFLKVHRVAKDRHLGVGLLLDAHFFGDSDLKVGARGKTGFAEPPTGYRPIRDYLSLWTKLF